jgi:glycosyltransferase involved in cell wall biosynthesis
MIKVAIILPGFDVGGTENMVANLVQNINKNEFEVLVISLKPATNSHIQKLIEDTGVKIEYANKKPGMSFSAWFVVFGMLRRFRPDLIHSNMYPFVFTVPYLYHHPKVKLLHTIHNKPVNEFKDIYKKVARMLYKQDKAIPVAISDIIKREMLELYEIHEIECIYNPVNVTAFEHERKFDFEGRKVRFINVARMMRQKNQRLLLDSFAKAYRETNGRCELYMVGDGELREELLARVKELNIQDAIKFCGNVSNVPDYLAEADVFVLSSDYEGLPLSGLEAMASGLPILSTEVGGMADIVTDNGILVNKGDEKALAAAIVRYTENTELIKEHSLNSSRNVKKYDVNIFVRKYEELYRRYARKR